MSSAIPPSPVTPAFAVGPGFCGGGCLAGATATPVTWGSLSPAAYLIFTEYSYTTEYTSNGSSIESPVPSTGALVLSTAGPTGTSTPKPRHHRLDEQARIGIGIAIPVAGIAPLLLALVSWRRFRKVGKTNVANGEHAVLEEGQPYLQRKAELAAEEQKKYELEAEERRYGLNGVSGGHGILEENSDDILPFCVRQELTDNDHVREFEAP